jgi:UDP-N-acetylglucosamine acyltransferase
LPQTVTTAQIHPTAIIAADVQLGQRVTVGPFSIIEDDVTIGDGTIIDSHARIGTGTRIGRDCHLHHCAVVGTAPQDLKYAGEKTELFVGDRTVIREFATLNRGTAHRRKTIVGADCLIMAYAHVAHDCWLGDHVILANAANLAGHVTIEDWVIIGGVVPVHQFVRLGAHCIIGGGFRVPKDIVPYAMAAGHPLKVAGINRVGLERRGFGAEQLAPLSRAFRLLFRSKLNTSQALDRIRAEVDQTAEVKHLLEFVENSERGITG